MIDITLEPYFSVQSIIYFYNNSTFIDNSGK